MQADIKKIKVTSSILSQSLPLRPENIFGHTILGWCLHKKGKYSSQKAVFQFPNGVIRWFPKISNIEIEETTIQIDVHGMHARRWIVWVGSPNHSPNKVTFDTLEKAEEFKVKVFTVKRGVDCEGQFYL
ncbi:MAG: hypothetical protein JKX82_04910 [Oleispira sp.]|nr:hypothetical protein [Oleispira sp.]